MSAPLRSISRGVRGARGATLTNKMQLLMEPVAWFDVLSYAGSFCTRILREVNGSKEGFWALDCLLWRGVAQIPQ
jgi:hypothetical protein